MKKLLVVVLLLVSVGSTIGAYAYWDDLQKENSETFTIGKGTSLELESVASVPTGKVLVPDGVVMKVNDVTEVELKYSLELSTEVLTDMYLYVLVEDVTINGSEAYKDLVIIDLQAVKSTVNDQEIIVSATVSLAEPEDPNVHLEIINQQIHFTMNFVATTDSNQSDLSNPLNMLISFSSDTLNDDVDYYLPEPVEITEPYIELNGEANIIIEAGTNYEDPGFTAYNTLGEVVTNTWTNGWFSTRNVGTYEMIYYCYSSNENTNCESMTRTITVVDTTAPVIEIEDIITLSVGEYFNKYTMPTATDNSDYYVPVSIEGADTVDTSIAGTYFVTYYAEDDSGNIAEVVVSIIVE